MQTVGRGAAVSLVLNDDSETQLIGAYLGGDPTTASFVITRLQNVIDIINNGSGTVAHTTPSVPKC